MTPFQVITLSLLALILIWEAIYFLRGRLMTGRWLLRSITWLLAAGAIAFPQMVTTVARTIDIHRGADLVVYLLALAFLGTTFHFYSRYVFLERQMTELIRHTAILEAERGSSFPPSDPEGDRS